MEDKDQLLTKYHNLKFVMHFMPLIIVISFGGSCMSLLLWFVTHNSHLLSIHKISDFLLLSQIILFICSIIISYNLVGKEEKLRERLGIEKDDKSC